MPRTTAPRTVAPGLTAPPTRTPGLMAPPTWADIAVGIMRIAATAPIIESLPSRIQASLGCGCRCRSRRANIIGLGSGARPVRAGTLHQPTPLTALAAPLSGGRREQLSLDRRCFLWRRHSTSSSANVTLEAKATNKQRNLPAARQLGLRDIAEY